MIIEVGGDVERFITVTLVFDGGVDVEGYATGEKHLAPRGKDRDINNSYVMNLRTQTSR